MDCEMASFVSILLCFNILQIVFPIVSSIQKFITKQQLNKHTSKFQSSFLRMEILRSNLKVFLMGLGDELRVKRLLCLPQYKSIKLY